MSDDGFDLSRLGERSPAEVEFDEARAELGRAVQRALRAQLRLAAEDGEAFDGDETPLAWLVSVAYSSRLIESNDRWAGAAAVIVPDGQMRVASYGLAHDAVDLTR